MITTAQIDSLRQSTVIDSFGERIGGVGEVLVSKASGRPEWVSVHQGVVGDNERFAPLAGATATEEELHLAFPKDLVRSAPAFTPDVDLTPADELALRAHYGGAAAKA
ncbi:MAG: photosystem reaction center subunit [Frankiales bacterium]|nr:photosystem reaction center subunit [Frankiales bacterium]